MQMKSVKLTSNETEASLELDKTYSTGAGSIESILSNLSLTEDFGIAKKESQSKIQQLKLV